MGCCRKRSRDREPVPRSVLCRKYITPLKILILISIWADALYAVLHFGELTLVHKLIMFIHLIAAITILRECQKSSRYHALHDQEKG